MKNFISRILIVVLICFSCCFLSSCRATRQEVQKTDTKTEALSVIKETYRDTTLYTPKAETNLIIPSSELSFKDGLNDVSKAKVYHSRNGNATAKATVTPQGVTIVATCDSLALVAKIKSELQKETFNQQYSAEASEKVATGYTIMNLITWFFIGVVIGCIGGFLLSKFIIP